MDLVVRLLLFVSPVLVVIVVAQLIAKLILYRAGYTADARILIGFPLFRAVIFESIRGPALTCESIRLRFNISSCKFSAEVKGLNINFSTSSEKTSSNLRKLGKALRFISSMSLVDVSVSSPSGSVFYLPTVSFSNGRFSFLSEPSQVIFARKGFKEEKVFLESSFAEFDQSVGHFNLYASRICFDSCGLRFVVDNTEFSKIPLVSIYMTEEGTQSKSKEIYFMFKPVETLSLLIGHSDCVLQISFKTKEGMFSQECFTMPFSVSIGRNKLLGTQEWVDCVRCTDGMIQLSTDGLFYEVGKCDLIFNIKNGGIISDSFIAPTQALLYESKGIGLTLSIQQLSCIFGRYTVQTSDFFFSMCLPTQSYSRVNYKKGSITLDKNIPVMDFGPISVEAQNMTPLSMLKKIVADNISSLFSICSKPCRTLFSRPSSLFDQCLVEWLTHNEVKQVIPLKQTNFMLKISPIIPRLIWGLHAGTWKWVGQEIMPLFKLPSCVISAISDLFMPLSVPEFVFKHSSNATKSVPKYHANDTLVADVKSVESLVSLLNQSGMCNMFAEYFIELISAFTNATPSSGKESSEFGVLGITTEKLISPNDKEWKLALPKLSKYITDAYLGVLTVQEVRRMMKRFSEEWIRRIFIKTAVTGDLSPKGTPQSTSPSISPPPNSPSIAFLDPKSPSQKPTDPSQKGKSKSISGNGNGNLLWPLMHATVFTMAKSAGVFSEQFLSLLEVSQEMKALFSVKKSSLSSSGTPTLQQSI
eukprot:TRINITY_DN152_c5_g1_i1.p1 TRINITY_DN152_c5_g1~~TRINITY_DN152_c5_g1_i1.p1  ORF type:complete len:756 (+),score=169.95 TRINITY_DN152_c5_g1_i1:118-2385(+)